MITWVTGDKVQEIRCLSTDTKPTNSNLKDGVMPNGTILLEMDTGKVFMFDYDNQRWIDL